ncbi:MAG: hypothetical protein C0520_00775 [Sphingopyxis sp.]|nr:hypothetical protein [Sphingopyxis sp.]
MEAKMAGDEKITLQVSSVSRASPVRKAVASGSEAPATVHAPSNTPAPVPVTRLLSLANELASEPPPVDFARIAVLRNAIASGNYAVDAALIAGAAVRFYKGSAT